MRERGRERKRRERKSRERGREEERERVKRKRGREERERKRRERKRIERDFACYDNTCFHTTFTMGELGRETYPIADHFLCQARGHHLGQNLFLALSLSGQFGTAVAKPCNVVLQR